MNVLNNFSLETCYTVVKITMTMTLFIVFLTAGFSIASTVSECENNVSTDFKGKIAFPIACSCIAIAIICMCATVGFSFMCDATTVEYSEITSIESSLDKNKGMTYIL